MTKTLFLAAAVTLAAFTGTAFATDVAVTKTDTNSDGTGETKKTSRKKTKNADGTTTKTEKAEKTETTK